MRRKKLGEILQERGKISSHALSNAIAEQQGKVVRLGELLLERGLVDKSDLLPALYEVARVPYLDCSTVQPGNEALEKIPRPIAERCCALPIEMNQARLVTVMAEPQNLTLIDELRFTSGSEIDPRFGFTREIQEAIVRCYKGSTVCSTPAVETPSPDRSTAPASSADLDGIEFVSTTSKQANREAFQEVQAEVRRRSTPAVQVVSEIIRTALARQASDIHIEPQAADTAVRLRVDGVLQDLRRVPRSMQNSLSSRIKILSDMDIAERRAPQDGRFLVVVGGRKVDTRVSTLPTQYGEKIVMRLLESEGPALPFAQLGFPQFIDAEMSALLRQPQGMLLVTGPTGSGKSTTLYAALHQMRSPSVNIVTVEDPVEYVLPGINQVHVNARAGLTFASCLRSILRQDPNVIMIGEIRDRETAEIAMKAAQTGHLVLSTLHTNDSVSAVIRLLDLEIPPYLIAASLTGILAQRLVRVLCKCRMKIPAGPDYRARFAAIGSSDPPDAEYRAVGCAACEGTGFKGRVGVYELLNVHEPVRAAIRNGQMDEIQDAARNQGMVTLQSDALDKVRSGITSLDEAMRVVSFERASVFVPKCAHCGTPQASSFRFCPHCGMQRDRRGADAPARDQRREITVVP
jgi:type IV pilus assembly protein PilB